MSVVGEYGGAVGVGGRAKTAPGVQQLMRNASIFRPQHFRFHHDNAPFQAYAKQE